MTDPAMKEALGKLMVEAAVAITQDREQSTEAFAWFRSSDDAIQHHRDGLTLDGQGLPPVMLTVAKLLPASSREGGDRFWVDQTRDVHTKTAAAYDLLLAADPHDPTTQVTGGRLLQHLHLVATAQGIGLHHMNQITERIDREHSTDAAPAFARRIATLLPDGRHLLAAFRIGYPVRASRLSPRRPLTDVTTRS